MNWRKVKDPDKDSGVFCPVCLEGKSIFFKRVPPHSGFKSWSSDSYYLYKCANCNWEGDPMDLLTLDVWKNVKRTELIDKILK